METTAIGRYSFDEAKEFAKKTFMEKFTFKGGNRTIMPPFLAAHVLGTYIVDTAEARYKNKIASRKT